MIRLLTGISALLLSLVVSQIIRYRYFHALKAYPGPFWAGVTRFWLAWHSYRETELEVCWRAVKKYGPIVRISPTMLLVASASDLPAIYHRNANKSPFYVSLQLGSAPSTFHSQSHIEHVYHRKLVAHSYSFSQTKQYEAEIDAVISQWLLLLRQHFSTERFKPDNSFDFTQWAALFCLQNIGNIAFSKDFGLKMVSHGALEQRKVLQKWLATFGFFSRLYPLVNWMKHTYIGSLVRLYGPRRGSTLGALQRQRESLLQERLQELAIGTAPKKQDMMQSFIDFRTPDNDYLPPKFLRAELLTFLLAGADTVASGLCASLFHILTSSPSVQSAIVAEIDAARAAHRLSPTPQFLEILEHCPFFVACVRENMRLSPGVPNILPRLVSAESPLVLSDGKVVPNGTEVASNPWISHRDAASFGEDAEVWRPQRWLEDRADVLERLNFTFGFGSRVCLGKDIALMEILKGVLCFLDTFSVTLEEGKSPPQYRSVGGVAFWENLWITIKDRHAHTLE